jgi:hypothetical protein
MRHVAAISSRTIWPIADSEGKKTEQRKRRSKKTLQE